MFITSQIAGWFAGKCAFILTYIIVVTLAGYVRAWVADYMGDSTPEQLGFLTLNPAAHISLLWIAFMALFTNFGFGRYIPINYHGFNGSFRWAKVMIMHLSDSLLCIALSILSTLLFMIFFNHNPLFFWQTFHTLLFSYAPFQSTGWQSSGFINFTEGINYLGLSIHSSYGIVAALCLIALTYMSMCIAAFNIVLNIAYPFVSALIERYNNFIKYSEWLMLLIPFIMLLLFVNQTLMAIRLLVGLTSIQFGSLLGALS